MVPVPRCSSHHLEARLRERRYVADARVRLAIARLSGEELKTLRKLSEYGYQSLWGRKSGEKFEIWRTLGDITDMVSTSRLLDKGSIRLAGTFLEGHPAYELTPFGVEVARLVQAELPRFRAEEPSTP